MSRSSSPQNIESSKVSPIQIEQHEISTSPIAQSTEERGHDIHIDESSLEDQGVSHHHGDDNEYYVESILAHRYKNGKIHYLVRWDGYPFYESSWEPEENLATAYHFLNDYRSHLERVQRGSSPSFDIETFDRGQEEYYQNKADEQDGSHSDCEPMDVLTTSEAKKSQLISLTSPEPRSVSRPSKAFSKLRAEHHRAIGPMKVKPLVPPARHHSPPKISIPASSLQKSRAPAPSTRQQHRTKRHVFKRGFFRKRKKEPAPDFSAVELVRPGNFTVAKKRRVSQDNHDPCVTVKSSLPNPTISLSQLPSFKKRPKAANEDDNTTLHPQSPESDRAENTGNLRILRELPSPHQQPLSVAPLPITEPPKETPKADVKLNPPTGPRQGRRSLSMQQYKQINRLNRTMSLDREDIANAGHHATPATTIPQIETKNLKPAEIPQGQNSSIWDGWWGNEGNHARAPTSADTTWNPAIWDPSVWGNQSTRRNSRPCSGHGFGKTMAVSPTDIDRPVSLDNPPRGPRSFDLQRPVDKPAKPSWTGDLVYGTDKSIAGKLTITPTADSFKCTLLSSLKPGDTLWLSKHLGVSYLIGIFKDHLGCPNEIYNVDFSKSRSFEFVFSTLEYGDSVGIIHLDDNILVLLNTHDEQILNFIKRSRGLPDRKWQIAVYPVQQKFRFAKELSEWKNTYDSLSLASVLLSQTVNLPDLRQPFLFHIWSPKETQEGPEMAMMMKERNGTQTTIGEMLEKLKNENTMLGIILIHRLWLPIIDTLPNLEGLKDALAIEFYVFGTDVDFVETDTSADVDDIYCLQQISYKIERIFPPGALFYLPLELYILKPNLILSFLEHLKHSRIIHPVGFHSLVLPTSICELIDEQLKNVNFSEILHQIKYMKYRLEQEIEQDSEYILTFNFNQTLLNKPYNLFAIEYLMKQCQFHLCTEYRKFVAVTLEQAASFRGGISYIDQELLMKKISRNL